MKLIENMAGKLGIKLGLVKLDFTSCGEIMIDGLPFSFGVESLTGSSELGFTVSISGEAVDQGRLRITGFERHTMKNGRRQSVSVPMKLVKKKDGKQIYQARFEGERIVGREGKSLKKATAQELMSSVGDQIDFTLTPHFSGDDQPEIMLSVYPFENPLNGSATKWLGVTSDKDWFLHRAENIRKIRHKKR